MFSWAAVENAADFASAIQLRRKRVEDNKFEAEPALLNPADQAVTYVYITNSKFPEVGNGKPEIEWKARIVNLRSFYEPPDVMDQMVEKRWGIHVDLAGWALPFTLVAALLF